MSGWTRQTARDIQDDQLGVSTRVAPTTPMKLAVCTTTGSAASAGTELGSTTRPSITFAAATNADPPVSSNSAAVNVTAGAAGTINGADIYDNAGTPVRKAWAGLTTPRTVAIGDILAFAIGAIQVQTAS
jgi:hypothetical protein